MTSFGNEQDKNPTTASSTTEPPSIDQEVQQAMGGMSIEDLMEKSLSKASTSAPNQPRLDPSRPVRGGRPGARRQREEHVNPDNIKHGKVIAIREGNAFIDIGGKSQGLCPLDQFDVVVDGEEQRAVEIGQEFEFIFKGFDAREGLVLLARKGAVQHGAWETLNVGDTVEALVTGVNKGGLELRVGNSTRAFMPAGQVDVKFHADLSVFLNQRFPCEVVKVDRESHNIILSRREIMEAEQAKAAEQTWEELAVGQVREGTVRSVQAYGAFVDVGGVDGLLHVSAMSHQRVPDPKKILKEGDKIQVMIVVVDKDKKRISLSLKSLQKDPFEEVSAQFAVGTTVTGTVKRLVDFGAFIELAPGCEGLAHVSQISMKRINKPSDVLKEGDTVQAKVLGIDQEKRRISLSVSEVERDAKIASGELKVEEPKPAAAGLNVGGAAGAKTVLKPKKNLKGGL